MAWLSFSSLALDMFTYSIPGNDDIICSEALMISSIYHRLL
jgi:hypothetical protein